MSASSRRDPSAPNESSATSRLTKSMTPELAPTVCTMHLTKQVRSAFACLPQRVDDTLKVTLFPVCH